MDKKVRGRFAPSPSGRMHLGNIYSALFSWLSVKKKGGEWLLRIEDLDRQRCRREYALQLEDDLRWLGLAWDEGGLSGSGSCSYVQSERDALYERAFDMLKSGGLVYPCYCSRADLRAASAPHASDGITPYLGTCRHLSVEEQEAKSLERKPSCRFAMPSGEMMFVDGNYGECCFDMQRDCGDFVVRRADGNFAYQLAVVVDDALMGVTEVVRGCDLLSSTPQQILLYRALEYAEPTFYHLPLLVSKRGQRLAKRDEGTDMGYLREHYTPQRLVGHIMWLVGLNAKDEPMTLDEALSVFDPKAMPKENITVV